MPSVSCRYCVVPREQSRRRIADALQDAELEGRRQHRRSRTERQEEATRSPQQWREFRRKEVAKSIENMRAASPLRQPIEFAKVAARRVRCSAFGARVPFVYQGPSDSLAHVLAVRAWMTEFRGVATVAAKTGAVADASAVGQGA